MSFIVATTRPCPACVHGPNAGGEHRPDSVTKRAVVTLEEARDEVVRIVDAIRPAISFAPALRFVESLTEAGGTVGPLPDGSVLEVEPATQARMRGDLAAWNVWIDTLRASDGLIAAVWVAVFNAREAGEDTRSAHRSAVRAYDLAAYAAKQGTV